MELMTTACVELRPTCSAPPFTVYPKNPETVVMMKPKIIDFWMA